MKKRLLHYEIVREVGRGGMGVVYEARDTHLDRPVAIKVLPADKVSDANRKRRFIQEAKAASALNHPNIVTIYDVTFDDGIDFIVMEYIAGRTLDSLIRSKGMRPRQVLKYAVQVADAMAKAHAAGILHRDLKPSNIMVTGEDRIKILDFGLAKLTDHAEISQEDETVTLPPFTEEGSVMGTAAYMSPEQAEGRKLDGRSDIFSFGTMLYEMVSMHRPFEGDSRVTLLAKIVNEDPRALPESAPAPLGKAILRCLRKDPARRFQTMADLKVALEDLEEESASSGAQAVTTPSRPRWVAAAIVSPVLLAAGYFGWWKLRTAEIAEPMTAVPLTTFSGAEQYPTFSPDGNQVAFMWNGPTQDNTDIYVQMIGSGSPLRLTTDPQADLYPAWSPDGRWIAFLRYLPGAARKYELRLVPPLGGPERKLAEGQLRKLNPVPGPGTAPRPAWSADSRFLVVTDAPGEKKPDALFAVSVETGEKRQLTDPELSTEGDVLPAISPNGRFLVFQRVRAFNATELYLLPLGEGLSAAGGLRRLTTVAVRALTPAWTSGSNEVVFSARGSLWRIGISASPSASAARLPFGEDGLMPAISRPQLDRPSRLAYVRNFVDSNIWRVKTAAPGSLASASPSRAISSTREDRTPRFSPDGRRVAFTSDRSGWTEIWLCDPDGSSAVQLTSMEAPNTSVASWSPDGQIITFESNLEGQNEIYSIPASGGKPRRLTTNPADDTVPSFSRDGKWIYFQSNRSGEPQVWKLPAAGGEATQITSNIGFAALESVDGSWLYYTQTSNSPSALWRVPTSGGPAEKLLDLVQYRAFDVLEKGIYYIGGDRQDGLSLQFFDFATRKSTTVSVLDPQTRGPGLTTSPDGRTILFTRFDSSVTDLMLVENFR